MLGGVMALRQIVHAINDSYHRSLTSQRQVVSVLTVVIVAKSRIPSEQQSFALIHRNVHRVGDFHVRRKIVITGHGDAPGNCEAKHFVPKRYLVDHVLKDVSAGIIPKESPIDEALRIELVGCGLAFELLPSNVLKITVRWNGPFPSAVGHIAIMMSVNGGDGAQAIWRGEFTRPCERRAAH